MGMKSMLIDSDELTVRGEGALNFSDENLIQSVQGAADGAAKDASP
jgi:hypothetical protein